MEPLSRTEKKNAALSLQDMGEKLVKLTDEQLNSIDLPENVLAAVKLAKTITKHTPLNRQMQYIGTLMRKYDTTQIKALIDTLERGKHKRTEAFVQSEKWRDDLIVGNEHLIAEILAARPYLDKQELTELVQQARAEATKKKPSPRASRALFRYLNKQP